MPARLTVYQADHPVRQFLLDAGENFLVGRDASCPIHIDDASLSRRHARLSCRDSTWQLADLASKNGTLVGGEPVTVQLLDATHWIEFGTVLACFDFVSDDALDADRRRVAERWQTSVELSRTLRPADPPQQLLAGVLESVIQTAGAERGFVVLAHGSDELRPTLTFPAGERHFSGSRSVVRRVFDERRAVVCSDIAGDAHLVAQPSIVGGGINALACLPLRIGDKLLGAIYVDSDERGKQFSVLDMDILQALADHAALVLGVARLRENLVDLSALLPPGIDTDEPPSQALIDKLQALLPGLGPGSKGGPRGPAFAGLDS